MSDNALTTSWPELVRQWQAALAYISEKTSSLPVSQVVVSLDDWLDFLLDPTLSATVREDKLYDLQQRFIRRWEIVAMHMMSGETSRMGRQILQGPADITGGRKPYGKDLADAFRSAVVALQNDGPMVEAEDVLPPHDERCAHVRMMTTRQGQSYMPVISYAPLTEVEWEVLLKELPKMLNVTLAVEGVSLIWLVGTLVRDLSGRVSSKPEVSYRRPGSGTRVKQLHLILGTEYQKQGEWLGRLARAVEGRQRKPLASLLAQVSLHRVTVQLFPAGEDYVLHDSSSLSPVKREISNRVAQAEQELRQEPAIFSEIKPREDELVESMPSLAPEPVAETAAVSPAVPPRPPTLGDLKEDAEWLRQRGELALEDNRALAKKYLLASTMLDNSSVDVWMTLSRLASDEREKANFLREAERVLSRRRR